MAATSTTGSTTPQAPFHTDRLSRTQALLILSAAALMISIAMGIRQSFGLFQTPIVQDIGVATSEVALAIAMQNLVWGLSGPFVGALIDRYGVRWVSLAGVALLVGGLAITAMSHNAAMIMLGSGLMVGISQSCTTMSIGAKIAAQVVVPARRSFAFGIVSAAGSIGTFFAAPIGQYVITSSGWRIGLVAFTVLALTMLPAAMIGGRVDRLRDVLARDSGQSLKAALGEAASHKGYVVMSIAYFVCGLQLTFLTTHVPSYLALCGQDPMLGAQFLAVVGLFNVIGCWVFGWLGDIFRKRTLLGLVYILRSAIIAVYFVTPVSPASTLIFAALMGLLWLSVIPLVNGMLVEIFGIRYMATLAGIAFMSHQVGAFVGAWGGGFIYDMLGSYDRAIQFGVIIGLIAGFFQLLMYDKPTQRMAQAKVVPAE
jgi:predicted MFS family arabinose efflux permease